VDEEIVIYLPLRAEDQKKTYHIRNKKKTSTAPYAPNTRRRTVTVDSGFGDVK